LFFWVFFEGVRRVVSQRERGQAIDSSPSLPNVRVGREVVVDRVDGAGDSRADGGEERVDLFVQFCKRGREEKRVRRRKGERERARATKRGKRPILFGRRALVSSFFRFSLPGSAVSRQCGSSAAVGELEKKWPARRESAVFKGATTTTTTTVEFATRLPRDCVSRSLPFSSPQRSGALQTSQRPSLFVLPLSSLHALAETVERNK